MELQRLNIGSLIAGMQNVDLIGSIGRVAKRDYSTEKGKGRVCSIQIMDETGSIRLVLWNDEIDRVEGIAEGDVVRVKGYIRQGLYGLELRLGQFGGIEKTASGVRSRKWISELKEGQRATIRAALLQLFESNPFYEICPKCGVSLKEDGGKYVCVGHGEIEPAYGLHISGVLDDGSGSIRMAAFREVAENILGVTVSKAKDIVLRKGVSALFGPAALREWVIEGSVRRSRLFDRLEFIVDKVSEPNIREETEILLMEEESKAVAA